VWQAKTHLQHVFPVAATNVLCFFTSITGSAPPRTLHIEWRGSRFASGSFGYVNSELPLFEGLPNVQVVYGQLFAGSGSVTIGAQKDTGSRYVQYACNTAGIKPGPALFFRLPDCGPPPTATETPPAPYGLSHVNAEYDYPLLNLFPTRLVEDRCQCWYHRSCGAVGMYSSVRQLVFDTVLRATCRTLHRQDIERDDELSDLDTIMVPGRV
jgi:hypothetical protein